MRKYEIITIKEKLLLVQKDVFGNDIVVAEQLGNGYVKSNVDFITAEAVQAMYDFLGEVLHHGR